MISVLELIFVRPVLPCIYARFRYSCVGESMHVCHCKEDENK